MEYEKGRDGLSESLRKQLERARSHTAFAYQHALARMPQVAEGLDPLFDHYDDDRAWPDVRPPAVAALERRLRMPR